MFEYGEGSRELLKLVARGLSTATTGGLGNPLVATAELGGAVITSLLAILAPALVVILIAGFVLIFGRKWVRKLRRPQPTAS